MIEDWNNISGKVERKVFPVEAERKHRKKNGRKRPAGTSSDAYRTQLPTSTPKVHEPLVGVSGSGQPGRGKRDERRVGERTFGTDDQDIAQTLSYQIGSATPNCSDDHVRDLSAALKTMQDISPRDALERLLVTQMIGVHNLAMEFMKRALLQNQTFEGVNANINRATRLLRTFTAQMEALNRHRGKLGAMVVGNVNVNDGGQAIVGPVTREGPKLASRERDSVEKDARLE